MTRIAIVGASGYAGGEVARLAQAHPDLEVGTMTAARNEGRLVTEVHPHLRTMGQKRFAGVDLDELGQHDVIVLALPHGQSGPLGEQLAQRFAEHILIDLGADRRLEDEHAWSEFYGGEYFSPWIYGMPELVRSGGARQREALLGAHRIVAPGCNATAVTLAVAPLVAAGLVDPGSINAALAVAPSGAGRSLKDELLASERLSSATAYAVGGTHRHIPEIAQNLAQAGGHNIALSLSPIMVPMSRGILAVTTAAVTGGVSPELLWGTLDDAYRDEPFVDLLPLGKTPSTGSVLGSNTVAIGMAYDTATTRVSIVSAIDNLYKGTAGAAIQSLNIALGWNEQQGLQQNAVAP